MKTLKNHERMELSWGNIVYNTAFSVETFWDMVCPYKSRNSCENNVLDTIFTIRAFKVF